MSIPRSLLAFRLRFAFAVTVNIVFCADPAARYTTIIAITVPLKDMFGAKVRHKHKRHPVSLIVWKFNILRYSPGVLITPRTTEARGHRQRPLEAKVRLSFARQRSSRPRSFCSGKLAVLADFPTDPLAAQGE
jgi:hypothetical protein